MKDIIIAIVFGVVTGFIALQFRSFKQWLLYAVCEAERFLGSKTGELKLQYVYNLAVNSKFSLLTKIITFDMFKKFVDGALEKMESMIENSEAIANILKGTKVINIADEETK